MNIKLHILQQFQDGTLSGKTVSEICKLLHIDSCGIDCTTRILNTGRFQVMLDEEQIPIHLTRDELETLLIEGTAPDWKIF